VVTVYDVDVRARGQLVVMFHGDRAAGCTLAKCTVQNGRMTWSPQPAGSLEVVDFGPVHKPRLEAFLGLSGKARASSTSVSRVDSTGTHTCTDTSVPTDDAQLPVAADATGGLTFRLFSPHAPLPLLGSVVETPLSLLVEFLAKGQLVDEPSPTHCGGPLPGDVLPGFPARRVSLARLRGGATTINLSGAVPFAERGFSGLARSTIVLRIKRLRGHRQRTRIPPTPLSAQDRVLTVQYRVAKVGGSVAVDAASVPSTCAAFDVCGLKDALSVQPGAAHGTAMLIAYDSASTSGRLLRRVVGLGKGRLPPGAQAFGLASWSSGQGSVSSMLTSGASQSCRDSAALPVGAVEISVHGRSATAIFGGSDLTQLSPVRDLLRTRCPGPVAGDVSSDGRGMAMSTFPVRVLGRRMITLHLTRGISVKAPGFSWTSRPNLTIVLHRISVTERLVPSSYFET
jgi:hypothetical protein